MIEDWHPFIEDYHLGRLQGEELQAFEAALAKEPALAKALEESRLLWELQELLAEKQLRAQIREGFEQFPPKIWWVYSNWKYLLAIALILLLCCFWLFSKKEQPAEEKASIVPAPIASYSPVDAQQVADSKSNSRPEDKNFPAPGTALRQLAVLSYRQPESLGAVRSQDEDSLSLALNAYKEKNYRQALEILRRSNLAASQEGLNIRAHAYFNSSQYAKALADFRDLERSGVYTAEGQWYGLLARMASAQTDRQTILKQVQIIARQAQHPYQQEATQLKSALLAGNTYSNKTKPAQK